MHGFRLLVQRRPARRRQLYQTLRLELVTTETLRSARMSLTICSSPTFIINSGLNAPIPAIQIPALDVPSAAPITAIT